MFEKKDVRYVWMFVIILMVVGVFAAVSDMWTSALYFQDLFGQAVLVEQIKLPERIFGEVRPVSFETLLISVGMLAAQITFGMKARSARKGSTEKKVYWTAFALSAIVDTFTDISFRGAGTVTVPLVLTSILFYNLLSEYAIVSGFSLIVDTISGAGGGWFDNAKENVKNLRGGGNDGSGPRPPKAPTGKQHNQQQRPSFAAQNDVSVSLQPREQKSRQVPVRQNGKQVGNARLREILANSE